MGLATDTTVYLSWRWERVKSTSRRIIPALPIHDGARTLSVAFYTSHICSPHEIPRTLRYQILRGRQNPYSTPNGSLLVAGGLPLPSSSAVRILARPLLLLFFITLEPRVE